MPFIDKTSKSTAGTLRLTLESWFTNIAQTPLNRSQQLPEQYKRLIDEIKQCKLTTGERRTGQLTVLTNTPLHYESS